METLGKVTIEVELDASWEEYLSGKMRKELFLEDLTNAPLYEKEGVLAIRITKVDYPSEG